MKTDARREMKVGIVLALMLYCMEVQGADSVAFGAAPEGDPKAVAQRIVQANFEPKDCPKIVTATRLTPDQSIKIACSNGETFRVFTIFDSKRGKTQEVAMRCSAVAKLGVKGC